MPNIVQYVDAAHGGWLGWQSNLDKFVPIIEQVLTAAGGYHTIRGFATNTANYQPLGSLSSNADPCNLESQGNQAIDESHYINMLNKAMNAVS